MLVAFSSDNESFTFCHLSTGLLAAHHFGKMVENLYCVNTGFVAAP